ncbi:hypothetical protein E0Z10_g9679 [Xylaria hypoxylon]|uniref:Erythromycin biosynthesis protein CIII-like C-terminal domain-containing protein n=1 Tax=Xylaria hypoxylon TaxID=37992 RepID=A0A4Z0Y7Z8_9PEZI|nr:hypothetical protein E0Z10_g9679 [Xylaria hypoxylon]
MLRHLFLGGSVTIAVLALIVSQWTSPSAPRIETIRQGRNNTVLFLTNTEHGLSNVFLATAYTLLERHTEVEVHYASFPSMTRRLERISRRAQQKSRSARRVIYHELPDLSFLNAMVGIGMELTAVVHPPGRTGINTVIQNMPLLTSPWSGEDHMTLFQKATDIIDQVDPSLVVLDVFMRPAIDATRNSSRLHAFISPLTPMETFPLYQPYGGWLWKYPVMGSGIPYPVPWTKLLENLYINVRYFYAMLRMAHYTAVQKYLYSKGLTHPVNFFNLRNADVPWFTQALPGASTPVDVIPQNVTLTGPMILSLTSAEEQAPVLTKWLARAPTVLINLGSLFMWTEGHAMTMAQVIADTLAKNSHYQVLWKFNKAPYDAEGTTYGDEFMTPLRPFLKNGRLRIESWLDVQPVSLLETGYVVASVHHGGAGCYSEALGTGVPQIVLPQWLDHYTFAQLAQDIGVGVWGCSDASPFWTTECLRNAFSAVLSGESGDSIRNKAKRFGDMARSDPGEQVAAREIAKLAASGYGS